MLLTGNSFERVSNSGVSLYDNLEMLFWFLGLIGDGLQMLGDVELSFCWFGHTIKILQLKLESIQPLI